MSLIWYNDLQDRLNNLNEFVEGDMEFLWTAPDLNDILKKIEDLKLPASVVNGKLIVY